MQDKIRYPFELVTERVSIRSPMAKDAEGLREAIGETIEDLQPWMPWANRILTLEEARENCSTAAQNFQEGKDHRLHFFQKDSDTFLGGSGLHRIDWSIPKVEIGYWIRKSCSGKGYVAEAVKEISRYALEDLKVNRVEIRMSSENEKSWRVAERLGFLLEGTLRNECRNVDGSLRDTRVYALTPGDVARMAATG